MSRYFLLSLLAGLTDLALARDTAQTNNPILRPSANEAVTPGSTYSIQWTPTFGSQVRIEIRDSFQLGESSSFGAYCSYVEPESHCGLIALDVPNTGYFDWHVPVPESYRANDPGFHIEISVLDYYVPEDGNSDLVVQYSGHFSFASQQKAPAQKILARGETSTSTTTHHTTTTKTSSHTTTSTHHSTSTLTTKKSSSTSKTTSKTSSKTTSATPTSSNVAIVIPNPPTATKSTGAASALTNPQPFDLSSIALSAVLALLAYF